MNSLLADLLLYLEEADPKTSFYVAPSVISSFLEKEPDTQKASSSSATRSSPPEKIQKVAAPIEEEKKRESPPISTDLVGSVKKLFPGFSIRDKVLEESDLDQTHKKILEPKMVLFSFREGKDTDLFLQNIQQAISTHFGATGVLDVKKWESRESLELFFKQSKAEIIIAPAALYNYGALLPYLKEVPATNERFLGSIRLLLLKPFHEYFKQPSLKKELWHQICAMLKTAKDTLASS